MQASFAPALRVRSRCAPRPMRRRRWRTRVCPSAPRTHTRRGPHPAHPTPFRRGMHQQLPACTLLCTDALPFALSVLPLRSHRSSSRRPLAAPSPLTSTLRTLAPPSASAPSRRRLALESVSSSMARRSTTARCSRRLCRRVSRIDPNTHTHTHTRTHTRTHARTRTHAQHTRPPERIPLRFEPLPSLVPYHMETPPQLGGVARVGHGVHAEGA